MTKSYEDPLLSVQYSKTYMLSTATRVQSSITSLVQSIVRLSTTTTNMGSTIAVRSSSVDTADVIIGDSIFYFLMGLIGLLVIVFVALCLESCIRDRQAAKKDAAWDAEQGVDLMLPDGTAMEQLVLGGGATQACVYAQAESTEHAEN